jgi:c-di-GMP-binding flagellar brake protein YcgR
MDVTTPETLTIPRKGAPRPSDALERIPADAGAHEMRDPFDIGEALETLARRGEAVSVHPAGMVRGLLLARLHSVDPDETTFVIDFLDALPPAGPATLVAALSGNAKVQFELAQEWRCLPGEPHLVPAQFPPFCLVLNRRAAQRVGTPVGVHNIASFNVFGKFFQLPVDDVSLGGVGLRATPEEAFGLRVGNTIAGVRLQLGPALVLTADLEVRLVRPFKTFLLGEQVQIGCSFSNISMQTRQSVDRYIASTNRIRRGA